MHDECAAEFQHESVVIYFEARGTSLIVYLAVVLFCCEIVRVWFQHNQERHLSQALSMYDMLNV